MEDADICPISLECGLIVHRRSIDVSRIQDAGWQHKPSSLGFSTSSSNTAGGASNRSAGAGNAIQQQLDAVSVRMPLPGRSPAGPMSTETPAELLTSDGRLNMDAMMEHSGHAPQHGLGFGKTGSFRFNRAPSSKAGFAGTAAEGARGLASGLSTSSCKAAAAAAAAASCRDQQAPQLPEQQMQLALACQLRDTRLLQQLLAAGVRAGAALDVDGNTPLHLVLLPMSNPAVVAAVHDSVRSHKGSIQHHEEGLQVQTHPAMQQQQRQVSSGGAFSWLTGCFTGGTSSNGSSSAVCSGSLTQALLQVPSLSPGAAAAAQLTMVAALLAAGADTNARSRQRLTPVMLAARQLAAAASSSQANAAFKVLEVLCKGGQLGKPDLNLKDAAGRTALAHALLPARPATCMDRSTVARAAPAAAGGIIPSEPAGAASASHSAGHSAAADTAADASVSAKSASVPGSAAAVPHAAVAAARVRAVQLLVHHGADTNAADADGMTPLMYAAAQPGVTKELLIKLLELGANSRLLDNKRRSALTHAMVAQQLRLVPALGPAGEEYRQQQQQQHCSCSSASMSAAAATAGCTPVPGYYYAAVGGRCSSPALGSSSAAPECMACPNCSSGNGAHSDCTGSRQQQELDTSGLSSCVQTAAGPSEACHNNNKNSSSSAASSSSQDGASGPMLLSSFSTKTLPLPNHGSVMRTLCGYGSLDLFPGSINTRFPGLDNYSQLHIAMRRGDLRATQLLLAGGADVDALDSYGNSPLMYWPVAPSEPEEVALDLAGALLAHAGYVDCASAGAHSIGGHTSQGADPNLHNNDGWTALDLACELSKLGKVLVKAEAVPVHALLVGYGATNSDAFLMQHTHQPTLACMRTDSANSVLRRNSRSSDSLRALVPSSCGEPVMMPSAVMEDFPAHFEE
ncbi:hypothetical protein COO60DRAFT_1702244 [Scenedesmus sp. NREL 46B-D3]|nr:hypothetical protein COO60DRAFT_1702244 [Scenedesmus sp. NREL 46B-D3]